MSRRRPAEEGLLFDLPLDTTPAGPAPAGPAPPTPVAAEQEEEEEEIEQSVLPLAEAPEPHAAQTALPAPEEAPSADEEAPGASRRAAAAPAAATLPQRFTAGLADLGVCAAVLVVLLVTLLAQGVRPVAADWPAGVLFLLAFSFLYSVLPLAFWGRTPGMALAGLRKSSRDGRPLTFRQAILTWLASVLTVALAGLPLLVALGGRSLGDLISGSMTRHHPA